MSAQPNGWLTWILTGLFAATVGSYAWSTRIAWRVEDRAAVLFREHEARLSDRLDRLEMLILEQFKRVERQRR